MPTCCSAGFVRFFFAAPDHSFYTFGELNEARERCTWEVVGLQILWMSCWCRYIMNGGECQLTFTPTILGADVSFCVFAQCSWVFFHFTTKPPSPCLSRTIKIYKLATTITDTILLLVRSSPTTLSIFVSSCMNLPWIILSQSRNHLLCFFTQLFLITLLYHLIRKPFIHRITLQKAQHANKRANKQSK